jgi:hypothetical protein
MGNDHGDIEAKLMSFWKQKINRIIREDVALSPRCLTTPFSHSGLPLLTHMRGSDIVGGYDRARASLKPIGNGLPLLKLDADNLQ